MKPIHWHTVILSGNNSGGQGGKYGYWRYLRDGAMGECWSKIICFSSLRYSFSRKHNVAPESTLFRYE